MKREEESRSSRVAALQDEIRSAGTRLDRGWQNGGILAVLMLLIGTGAAGISGMALLAAIAEHDPSWIAATIPFLAVVLAGSCGATLAGSGMMATAALYERSRRAEARRRLAHLAPEERRQALLPLQADGSPHARVIMRHLLREFGVRGEVSPAAPPDGRGDELAG